ncbi:MAG: amidohydrolase [Chlorobiaceae bacterium]|nr:amidohydrolase [Chlorobiaceae bacterium]
MSTIHYRDSIMKKFLISLIAVLLIIIVYFLMNKSPREIDTLLINGNIYTCDSKNSIVDAIAIQGTMIVGVGKSDKLSEVFFARQVIDLKGKTVLPGLVDGHAHILGEGGKLENLDLSGTTSTEQIVMMVAERIKNSKKGDWILGRGWDQNSWQIKEFPKKEILDKVSSDNPVFLRRVDGHAAWANTKALQLAGIDASTKDTSGGKIVRDKNGTPTGILVDNAIEFVNKIIPPLSNEDIERRLVLAMNECASLGLTEVHDMGVDEKTIQIYKKLIDEGRCPIRIYAAIDYPGDTWNQFLKSGPLIAYKDGMLTVRAVKLYMDGALGSRGAAFFEEYTDDPGNRGLTLMSEKEMETVCRNALEKGFQVCTHAIGDRANSITLDIYGKAIALKKDRQNQERWRVEHVQVLSPNDIQRFKKLNVLPSMQPTHATSDMEWAENRIGPDRIHGAYAWRSILNTGAEIISGSDFPVESVNPFYGLYSAVTRQDQNGVPQGGWYPEQKMSRVEALNSFTRWAAYGAFQENSKGTIETGKWADFTIIDRDIIRCNENEIYSTKVEMTIVGGKIVYKK